MHAYDLEIQHRSIPEDGPRGHGWCFGLPPGIRPAQWPLDPTNGYPLSHGFTLLLPEDYRVHGPDIVALSFFAIACDHNDGGPASVEAISRFFENFSAGMAAPEDPQLAVFWEAERQRHPRLHRMEDLLGCPYAVILLTQEEFDGPLCAPPAIAPHALRDQVPAPAWLTVGAAAAFWGYDSVDEPPMEQGHYQTQLGEQPRRDPAYHRALAWTARRNDPNAGHAPLESPGEDDAYQREFYWEGGVFTRESYRERDWAQGHLPNHIGGTMRPVQAIEDGISPFYVEFEEYLGGYNFGSGNGWLDFQNMRFDWSQ